ncbi:unnamed protein product [Prorocentrum cordatum]|uniref:Uncharacterized protein n=1 Tax=Prorocentrum cordatum TaxID=2364126 RepID=A0ABN9QFR3_9DINO|nr:unnamed protein product [Polarella glacialis]
MAPKRRASISDDDLDALTEDLSKVITSTARPDYRDDVTGGPRNNVELLKWADTIALLPAGLPQLQLQKALDTVAAEKEDTFHLSDSRSKWAEGLAKRLRAMRRDMEQYVSKFKDRADDEDIPECLAALRKHSKPSGPADEEVDGADSGAEEDGAGSAAEVVPAEPAGDAGGDAGRAAEEEGGDGEEFEEGEEEEQSEKDEAEDEAGATEEGVEDEESAGEEVAAGKAAEQPAETAASGSSASGLTSAADKLPAGAPCSKRRRTTTPEDYVCKYAWDAEMQAAFRTKGAEREKAIRLVIPSVENGLLKGHCKDFPVAVWPDGDTWSVPHVSAEKLEELLKSSSKGSQVARNWVEHVTDGQVRLVDFKRSGFSFLAIRHEKSDGNEQFAQQSLRDFNEDQISQIRKHMEELVHMYAKNKIDKDDLIKKKISCVAKVASLTTVRKRPAAKPGGQGEAAAGGKGCGGDTTPVAAAKRPKPKGKAKGKAKVVGKKASPSKGPGASGETQEAASVASSDEEAAAWTALGHGFDDVPPPGFGSIFD